MSRALSPESNLDTLKKEAKRWLKALRDGDAAARGRLLAVLPGAPDAPGLRDVQHALAREHGLAGWDALRAALEALALARRSRAERAEIVLRAVWQGGDTATAARILAQWPDFSRHSLPAAVVTGDLAEVRRRLAADPGAAGRPAGPLNWEPILYLAFTRYPGAGDTALEMAALLLDQGGSAAARFSDDWENPFTALTGTIGEGEGDQPPHPHAVAMAELLLARGAGAYDTQALYNTSITRDETFWLDFLWERSARQGLLERWSEVLEKPTLGGRVPMSAIDYLLGNAVAYDHRRRAEWLIGHGANADGRHAYSGRRLREEALVHGHVAMAALLERHGAVARPLEGRTAFKAACMRLDREAAAALAAENPACLKDAEIMMTAARQDRVDVVRLLLALGMDKDIADNDGLRGIQSAVLGGSIDVVRLLVEAGADIDSPTKRYDGALGFANHFERHDIIALLAPLSRDIPNMVNLGLRERLAELFAAEPGLVNAPYPGSGLLPLFVLPQDDTAAAEMAEFLLAHGADRTMRSKQGQTPAERARQRGLVDAAEVLEG